MMFVHLDLVLRRSREHHLGSIMLVTRWNGLRLMSWSPCRLLMEVIGIISAYSRRLFHKVGRGLSSTKPGGCNSGGILVKEFVCHFGTPQIIHSDQGRNFESAIFTEMCQLLEIAKPGLHHWTPSQTGWLKDSTVPLSLRCQNLWMQTNVTGMFMFRSY